MALRSPILDAYAGLGSNLGDRLSNFAVATSHIERLGVKVLDASSVYETEPVGYKPQPWFLNQVLRLAIPAGVEDQAKRANDLLKELLSIEEVMGRAKTFPDGPRLIDIDLLFYGSLVTGAPTGSAMANPHGGHSRAGSENQSKTSRIRTADLVLPHPSLHQRRFVLAPLLEIAPDLVHPVTGGTIRELFDGLNDASEVHVYRPA
ncbi:MAG TPA: 2-amino-4-hydroxy-6-hydroxymethyldihydropteridine diphosphokinase [Blastocatellia bacterium]|nr:2-amino-4-hydroxy-6-hydroxymethyldihydropteridine diphosphokinase [Blastocatellia bacterium]